MAPFFSNVPVSHDSEPKASELDPASLISLYTPVLSKYVFCEKGLFEALPCNTATWARCMHFLCAGAMFINIWHKQIVYIYIGKKKFVHWKYIYQCTVFGLCTIVIYGFKMPSDGVLTDIGFFCRQVKLRQCWVIFFSLEGENKNFLCRTVSMCREKEGQCVCLSIIFTTANTLKHF